MAVERVERHFGGVANGIHDALQRRAILVEQILPQDFYGGSCMIHDLTQARQRGRGETTEVLVTMLIGRVVEVLPEEGRLFGYDAARGGARTLRV